MVADPTKPWWGDSHCDTDVPVDPKLYDAVDLKILNDLKQRRYLPSAPAMEQNEIGHPHALPQVARDREAARGAEHALLK